MLSFYETLQSGGRCVIRVPQGQWLYGSRDEAVSRVKRYSKAEFEEAL